MEVRQEQSVSFQPLILFYNWFFFSIELQQTVKLILFWLITSSYNQDDLFKASLLNYYMTDQMIRV